MQQLESPPQNSNVVQIAILRHQRIRAKDFIALLISLAERGYLMVTYRESRVLFLRTSKSEGLQAVERGLIAVLFPEENQVTY